MEASRKHIVRLATALVVLAFLPLAGASPAPDASPVGATARGGLLAVPALAGLAFATARLTRDAALRDPVLRVLREVVEGSRGGVTASEAATLASARMGEEIDRKCADFHLSQLTRLRILRRHKVGTRRLYLGFDAPAPPPPEPLATRILAFVRANPGISAAEAAAKLGVTDTRFDRHLKDLMQMGLVARWRPHGASGFLLAAAGQVAAVDLPFAR